MQSLSLEERIKIIENSNSLAEIAPHILPASHKDSYYFVSYSHKDYKIVLKDILRLESLGINIWYDSEMHIGENWQEIAQLYISKFQCKGVIFYLSENSITSPACNKEIEYVLTHNKKFFSINVPLDGCGVQSGLAMLKEMQRRGFECDSSLIKNFEDAFADNVLYLSIEESIEKKAHEISAIKGEKLLMLERASYFFEKYFRVTSCRDNSIISLDISKIYDDDGFSDTIGAIGDCVFTNCIKLRTVKVSDRLFQIGDSAFRNCTSLQKIDLSRSKGVKVDGSSSDSGVEIDRYAFKNCTALREIDLTQIKIIGAGAFENCINLDIDRLSGRIYENAFMGTAIKKVIYLEERPCLFDLALAHCKHLEEFNILHEFKEDLGSGVFYDCELLKKAGPFIGIGVRMPQGAIRYLRVGGNGFYGCKALEEVKFVGEWDMSDAAYLFGGCVSLKKIDIDITGKVIPGGFANKCENLSEVTNSSRFASIGIKAFFGCKNLKYFDFLNVVIVNEDAFSESGLEAAIMPNVKQISRYAFCDAHNLKIVYIGENCKHIYTHAFCGCYNLETVKILSEQVNIPLGSRLFRRENEKSKNIKTFYLRSNDVFSVLKREGVLDNLQNLYIGDNLNICNCKLNNFEQVESDEQGFYKFVRNPIE